MNQIIYGFIGLVILLFVWWLTKLLFFKPLNINHFFERIFIQIALMNPELLSTMGILERFGLNFHNDDLTDISDRNVHKMHRFTRRTLRILRDYDREKLSKEKQLSSEILDWYLDDLVRGQEFMYHDYPVNQFFGTQNELPNFMATLHPLNSKANVKNYVKRLNKFDVKFEQLLEGLRIRTETGVIPPKFVIQRVLTEMREFIDADPQENLLYTSYEKKLLALSLDEYSQRKLLDSVLVSIENCVYPAYRKLITFFKELESVATEDDGVWKLPNGEAYYAYKLRSFTSTNQTADEIHEIGKKEVERIEVTMRATLDELGHTEKSIVEHMDDLSQAPEHLYENNDESRERALREYQTMIDHIDQNLDNLFDVRPKSKVKVERVPEFRETTAPGAYYMIPSMDGSRPGVFYANLRDMNEVPKYSMQTLAYHEAIPGHHFQLALAQELKGVPTFRKLIPFTAYVEGWALYAEKIAYENGFFDDPYSQLGYLESELFRAVRLVVDTGIHHKRWTREEAIAYMREHIGQPIESIITEVERYIVYPGQACAYKIGELKIVELRDRAISELGDLYNIRDFHNIVLQNGSMPLEILERRVNHYIHTHTV